MLLLAAFSGCAAPEKQPLGGPEIQALVSYYAGEPIGGPLDEEAALALEIRAEEAVPIEARLYLLAELPGERYTPLTEQVKMIVAGGGSEPLIASSMLTPGTRLATGQDAVELIARAEELLPYDATLAATFTGLTLPGVTTRMNAGHLQAVEVSGFRPADRRITVELWREDPSSPSLSIALTISDIAEVLNELESGEFEISRRPRLEKLMLDAKLESRERPVAIFAPARFDPTGRLSYLLVLQVSEESVDDDSAGRLGARLDLVRGEVRDAAIEGADRREQLLFSDRVRLRHLHAIGALDDERHRRQAILELSGGTPVAMNLALMAGPVVLGEYIAVLVEQRELLKELAGEVDALSWLLEREAVSLVATLISEREMPAEYNALLVRETGEAGRLPGILLEVAAEASSVEAFYSRVVEENVIALQDSNPASRVRAHDWLQERGASVPDFDPLAPNSDRRAALRAWNEIKLEAAKPIQASEGP